MRMSSTGVRVIITLHQLVTVALFPLFQDFPLITSGQWPPCLSGSHLNLQLFEQVFGQIALEEIFAAFAARANFGNENSIRGSVYHLVFVFLDSPDEVRRFRIAKQFRELPEGIRRSREFTFTRR